LVTKEPPQHRRDWGKIGTKKGPEKRGEQYMASCDRRTTIFLTSRRGVRNTSYQDRPDRKLQRTYPSGRRREKRYSNDYRGTLSTRANNVLNEETGAKHTLGKEPRTKTGGKFETL